MPTSNPRLAAFLRKEMAPILAVIALIVAATAFLNLADEVGEGETHGFDKAILYGLRQAGDPTQPIGPHWLHTAAADLTALGSVSDLGVIVLLVVGLFFGLRRWREALILLLASGGGIAITQWLKVFYGRDRPPMALHAVDVVNASFPSGHAMLTASVYLTLGALVARFAEKRRIKIFVMGWAIALTLVVGATRVYLGVHWPTDVLAGWCLGGAWATFCWLVAYELERRTGKRLTTDAALEGAGPSP